MSTTTYVWLKCAAEKTRCVCVCSFCFLLFFDPICETDLRHDLRQVLHTRTCRFRFVSLCVKLLRPRPPQNVLLPSGGRRPAFGADESRRCPHATHITKGFSDQLSSWNDLACNSRKLCRHAIPLSKETPHWHLVNPSLRQVCRDTSFLHNRLSILPFLGYR